MDSENRLHTDAEHSSTDRPAVSPAVIRRLPRYFRYLRELIREGKLRISSGELSERMGVTASQIRQDLNCFGGFGQQGYGYNVNYLYAKISDLLGVGAGLCAVIVGAGDLGRALVRSSMFEKRGVDVVAMFDVNPDLIGREFGGVKIYDVCELETFCLENAVDMAVLTLPKDQVEPMSERLMTAGIRGLWNFTGKELNAISDQIIVENVHLGDSLMILNYQICRDKPTVTPKEERGETADAQKESLE
ncbi:MAG: redox-sensing transcriptional repressor Rex [Clostridia bacterium]|nr:redox-sensing transcriptional repressor Rex [Clostridia bacterium]